MKTLGVERHQSSRGGLTPPFLRQIEHCLLREYCCTRLRVNIQLSHDDCTRVWIWFQVIFMFYPSLPRRPVLLQWWHFFQVELLVWMSGKVHRKQMRRFVVCRIFAQATVSEISDMYVRTIVPTSPGQFRNNWKIRFVSWEYEYSKSDF